MLASQGWPLHMMDDQGSIEKCSLDAAAATDDHAKSANSSSLRWQSAVQELKGEGQIGGMEREWKKNKKLQPAG